MDFKILNFKKYQKNTLQGFFDLQIGPLTIRGFTYHTKGEKSWAGMPASPQVKKGELVFENGVIAYFPVVMCDKERRDSFQDWIRKEIEPLLSKPVDEQPAGDDDIPF